MDLVHKAMFAAATGLVADALVARTGPGPGQRHAERRPGRVPDVGQFARDAGAEGQMLHPEDAFPDAVRKRG